VSDRDLDVLVVGAGICGLAAAYALTLRGARVLVVERAGVGAEQSAGLARIFRVAHVDPELLHVALHMRQLVQRRPRRHAVRQARDAGAESAQPQRQPRALESGVTGDEDPFPAPERRIGMFARGHARLS